MKHREFWIKGRAVLCDTADYSTLSQFKWHIKKDKKTYYAVTNVYIGGKSRSISMHRILTGIRKSEVDHINRNGLDNRRSNLRFATAKQNQCNRVRFNRFGYRGVTKSTSSNSFTVQIQIGGKRFHKYGFKTAEEAARHYDKLSKEHHGEFGIRNFKE